MRSLSGYWWVVLAGVIGALIYWFVGRPKAGLTGGKNISVDRARYLSRVNRLIAKLGTRLVTGPEYGVNTELLDDLGRQAARLLARKKELIIVTSGAVHLGQRVLRRPHAKEAITYRQAAAAIGQPELMRHYSAAFEAHGVIVAQVLLTMGDIADRERYLHIRSTFDSLLRHGVVPIVNENDCVSEPSVTFGENDRLAAVIAAKVQADLLVFLTDQPGFRSTNPAEDPAAELVRLVRPSDTELISRAAGEGGPESRGGMAMKLIAARTAVECGIPAIMADGREPSVLLRLLEGEELGTFFVPEKRISSRKSWLASATTPAGAVVVDEGARRALLAPGGRSLLPAGVIGTEGEFQAGEVLAVRDPSGREIARGITNFSSVEIAKIAGAHTNDVPGLLGRETAPEIIHRDNLVISPSLSKNDDTQPMETS
ncbi:MAG: glutamate 5-kinase [Candidatus Zipacnadales bacterium]